MEGEPPGKRVDVELELAACGDAELFTLATLHLVGELELDDPVVEGLLVHHKNEVQNSS